MKKIVVLRIVVLVVFLGLVAWGIPWITGIFNPNKPPDNTGKWGRFSGNPRFESIGNGKMKLTEDFAYTDTKGVQWLAPKDCVVDGASIPQLFWTTVGSPFTGPYLNASICHDVECDRKTRPWSDVHRMFYEGCLCGGVDETKAKSLYFAVYHFGPRWEFKVEMKSTPKVGPDGVRVFEAAPVRVPVPTKGTDTPPNEVKANVEKYIKERNPSLDEIEKLNPENFGMPKTVDAPNP